MHIRRTHLRAVHPEQGLAAFRARKIILEMLVALCLAFLVWLYTRSRDQEILDQVTIPVQVKLDPKFTGRYELETGGPSRVTASFMGPPSRIRELRGKLQRGLVQVAVNFTIPEERQNDSSFCNTVRIEPASVPVPPGVIVVLAEETNAIPVTVSRLVERTLPVRLDYAGEYRLSQVKLEPGTVEVRGPKEILDRVRVINTKPFSLPSMPESGNGTETAGHQVDLVSELEGRAVQAQPRTVTLRCKVVPRQKTYELADVPVQFLCPPNFPWRPRFAVEQAGKVNLKVIGPAGDEAPPVLAFVDLTRGNIGQGRNLEPLRFQLPRDFQLVQESPLVIPFYLEPTELKPVGGGENSTARGSE